VLFEPGDNAIISNKDIKIKVIWEQNAYYLNFIIDKNLLLNYTNSNLSENNKLDLIR
jgi:hypothetical protein